MVWDFRSCAVEVFRVMVLFCFLFFFSFLKLVTDACVEFKDGELYAFSYCWL